ncbi:glutathione S-transferase T3-like protein [Tanacetum coccineum]
MGTKAMEDMEVVLKRFGDVGKAHLLESLKGFHLRYQLAPLPLPTPPEPEVIQGRHRRHCLRRRIGFQKILKKLFRPIFGSRKEEKKDNINLDNKNFKFIKAFSSSKLQFRYEYDLIANHHNWFLVFQDPAEADKLLKIQRELDETKIILHKTIDSVLERGEKLDSLVEKSSDLSAASQFNAAYKRAKRLGKSGENDVDYLKRAQSIYRDEHRGVAFSQEDAWAVLRFHPKWDAPEQVDLTGDVPGASQEDLFGHDARPRPPGKQRPAKKSKSDATASTGGSSASAQFGELMEQELRLKREAAERAFEAQAEKDRTLMRLEELRFLATSTKDLDEDDAYWIKKQKKLIKNKMKNDLGDEDDEDEDE